MKAIRRFIANLLWPMKDAIDHDQSEMVAKWAAVLTGDKQEVVRGEFGGRERWLIKDRWCLAYRSKAVQVFDEWRAPYLDADQWANPNDFWNPAR